mmetsp:Transcript_6880/g.10884  ORF Transcript_6880/g.10884 Transcript_6880/m.10884 type:complete len:98 (-) Transcript_6880:393-686(-)
MDGGQMPLNAGIIELLVTFQIDCAVTEEAGDLVIQGTTINLEGTLLQQKAATMMTIAIARGGQKQQKEAQTYYDDTIRGPTTSVIMMTTTRAGKEER